MKESAKQKILLLLLSGVALGFSRTPRGYFKILKGVSEAWREIERSRLYRIVGEFYNDRLVDCKEDKDGFVKIVLTKEGQKKRLNLNWTKWKSKNRQSGTENGES